MLTYILRRMILMVPTLFGITVVVFAVMAAAPGGISALTLVEGQGLEPQAQKAMEEYYNRLYGLDQPAPVQFGRWLNNISPIGFAQDADGSLTGWPHFKAPNLGTSFRYGRPVVDLIAERLPITLLLNVLSIPLIYIVAVAVGVRAATQHGQAFDSQSGVVLLALWSVPTMLAGVLLIGFFASDQFWQWFPTGGISQRAALDMTFLPTVEVVWALPLLLVLPFLGAALGIYLARTLPARIRGGLGAVLGALCGWLMFRDLAVAGMVSTGVAMGVGAAVGWLMAHSDWGVLRGFYLGTLGLGMGLALALGLAPGSMVPGFLLDRAWHLVLPVLCLSYGGLAFLAKLSRSAVLENLTSDYARTARAKGVAEHDVLWRHVFRNSLLPLITVSATLLPSLLAGSVIVEAIFSIDGMGKLAVEAVQTRDRELVLSITLISGVLTLVGYLLADLAYAIVDPRVNYD
ncbi:MULTISPECIES: ABC transporter permease [unclassified Thioalkalivibrio]|uniref:ABC transporter permease n=1 Tax=unclassified Thioalkalivibrio TaxID=2621013 RepID=UPI00035EE315|nr:MULTISPECIES: ABC transporter permease [unclassified Thioalkalivibrio]